MEYQTKCGCIVVDSPPNFRIKYCPKHGAAPSLAEACDLVQRAWVGDGVDMATAVDAALLALDKVKGFS